MHEINESELQIGHFCDSISKIFKKILYELLKVHFIGMYVWWNNQKSVK